jgi:hypothetical protein
LVKIDYQLLANPAHPLQAFLTTAHILPDTKTREVEYLQIIDESGEDYLYPQNQFVIVELPKEVQQKLLATVEIRLYPFQPLNQVS